MALNIDQLIENVKVPKKKVKRRKKKVKSVEDIVSKVPTTKAPRKRKEIQGTLRKHEPGINVGTGKYKTVAQHCSSKACNDIKTHFLNSERKMLRCSYCGQTVSVGVK